MKRIYKRLILIYALWLLFMGNVGSVFAQTEISVPFPDGWIGTVGSNAQQAQNVKSFSTMGIRRVFLTQMSNSGSFEIQGNDVTIVLKIELLSGTILELPGTLTWRVTSGNNILAFGIIPTAGSSVSYTYNSTNYSIYGKNGTDNGSNIVLKKVGVTLSYTDGSSISGNAAQVSSMLAELNAYLATVNASKPQGPVTVSTTSTCLSATNIIVSGTATLQSGESLSVSLNNKAYTLGTNLSLTGTSWTLTVPNTGFSTGIYDVQATITNSNGYTLIDGSMDELTIFPNPSIATQPISQISAVGSSVTLSVSVSGGSGSYTYQWQQSSSPGGAFTNVSSGGTTASYSVPTGTAGTTYYRVLINDTATGCTQLTSSEAYVTLSSSFSFSAQPQSTTECQSASTTLSCSTSNASGTVTYQWQNSTTSGGTFTDISGATSSTYNASTSTPGITYYRVIATDNGTTSITSNEVSVTVNADPTIESQSSSTITCVGTTTPLSVTATGGVGDLNYQWQSSTASGGPFADISGATSDVYDAPITTVGTIYYQVVITNGGLNCGTVTSTEVSIQVVDPQITTQPQSIEECKGTYTTLSVTATGGTLSYTWQSSDSQLGPFADISGANSSTYQAPIDQPGIKFYRVIVSHSVTGCNVTSYVASVTVDPVSLGGTVTATDATICSGSSTTITLTEYTGTIQWQSSADNSNWSNVSGETSADLNTGILTATTYYRAVVTSGFCSSSNSSMATVTLNPTSVGGTATANDATVCSGSSTTITLTEYTGTIQWQSSADNSNWSNVSGETSTDLNTGILTATTYYRAVVTSGVCSSSNSSMTTVTVNPTSVGGTSTATDATVCSGSSTTITLTEYTGIIQWQISENNTDWNNISGETSASLSTGTLTATTYYRAVVTSGVCSSSNSSVTPIIVSDCDNDGDGVTDAQEIIDGTDPLDNCSFILASQSLTPTTAWNNADCDGDGVINGTEKTDGTNPLNNCSFVLASQTLSPSTAWENADCDGDGVTNKQEILDGTDPQDNCLFVLDSQSLTPNTAWENADCDGDGVTNKQEILDGTDPLDNCSFILTSQTLTPTTAWNNADCDGDGVTNATEKTNGTDPKNLCSFVLAGQTLTPSTAWDNGDCDGDGVTNATEKTDGTDPKNSCSFVLTHQTLAPSTSWNNADCDNDGLNNGTEKNDGTDPLNPNSNPDSDGDGVPDNQEILDGTDPNNPCSFVLTHQTLSPSTSWNNADCDNDGVNNGIEKTDGTNPNNPDSDGDGVTDGKEKTDGTNPLNNCSFILASQTLTPTTAWNNADCDGDGVTNKQEKLDGTDPLDNCSFVLASQTLTPTTAWYNADCDNDGVNNGTEMTDGTNPNNPDTDGDGVTDGKEKTDGTDPLDNCSFILASQTLTPTAAWNNVDCDNDGVNNGTEKTDSTNPNNPDTDGDGVTDGKEKTDRTDPLDNCSLIVANQSLTPNTAWKNVDCDGDGVSNEQEKLDGTDPLDNCSFVLASQTLIPTTAWENADCDGDGVSNKQEKLDGTDFEDQDSDGDGVTDSKEKADGTNPNDPCSLVTTSQTITPTANMGSCAPVAVDDRITSGNGLPVNGNVSVNDNIPNLNGGNIWTLKRAPLHGKLVFSKDGSYTYTADIRYDGEDSFDYEVCNVNGNCSEATVYINDVSAKADLSVAQTVNNISPRVGETVTFTISVNNYGPENATGVKLTDLLPSGCIYVSSTASSGTYKNQTGLWSIGNLALNGKETLTVTAKIYSTGDYKNVAVISGDQNDPNAANNRSEVSLDEICELFVPEIFSPNGDGIQDFFKIRCIDRYLDAKIEVYNRWGNLVYLKDHYGDTDFWGTTDAWWDGSSNQKWKLGTEKLPAATYFWILYLNNGSEKRNGYLYLNR